MTGSRSTQSPGTNPAAGAGAIHDALVRRGAPHGYDAGEFSPGESSRDFGGRRTRGPDEERLLLRAAHDAFEGPDRRPDADTPDADADAVWDEDAGADLAADAAPSPRLYRD